MLIGSLEDTIMGQSEASAVTQFNTTFSYKVANNLEIDWLDNKAFNEFSLRMSHSDMGLMRGKVSANKALKALRLGPGGSLKALGPS